ncbi:putative membrane protein [Wickerhamomyces ciferrii]|uniref:Membrane protein n=1 Tax=Wickerhamomyces ciferrii (strain ATCC 14091 / BCRC 22168 / CBS 111 / JCM 3599 / NBRC 0793 / NRRL Y-1031 F-60-10) TaxID=1206466 RepID=K0KW51_WICCF|nr:uncharacterized protein BN7_5315 [Wickerhamomyces ciferrii]CCH45729.1 putative membrane protein [Wickerhamomyces ciferrii]
MRRSEEERIESNSTLSDTKSDKQSVVPKDKLDPSTQVFDKKYGDQDVHYVDPPVKTSAWFTKPYALNYKINGEIYRTKGPQRSAGKLELFLDLVYVGIGSTLAQSALKEPNGFSFMKYVILFIPAITVWSDLKDFMNYYYNDDLVQKIYVCWIELLLIVYDNNCEKVELNRTALITTVISYFLARITLALMLWFYSIWVKQHRVQMRIYATGLIITSSCWFFILLIKSIKGQCIFCLFMFLIEHTTFLININPWINAQLGLKYTSALNIEHEDARFQAFYSICIGQFVTTTVMQTPLSIGWNLKLHKGFSLLLIAFVFYGVYTHRDGCLKAVHALKRNALCGYMYLYFHIILIASMLLAGNAGATLATYESIYISSPQEKATLLFYHGGILCILGCLTILPLLDKNLDDRKEHKIPRFGRVGLRIPIGLLILGLSWADKSLSILQMMWMDCAFLIILFIYEFTVMNPLNFKIPVDGKFVSVQQT